MLNSVVVEDGKTKYQGVQLSRFDAAKKSLQNNIVTYVQNILLSLYSRFGALTEDDATELEVDQRAFTGDRVLRDICSFFRHKELDPFRGYD